VNDLQHALDVIATEPIDGAHQRYVELTQAGVLEGMSRVAPQPGPKALSACDDRQAKVVGIVREVGAPIVRVLMRRLSES
jgi:hypothetical protein